MNKLLTLTAVTISLASFQDAYSGPREGSIDVKSYEEVEASNQKIKTEWEAMAKEDKLLAAEEKRKAQGKTVDKEWEAMSDDDKISSEGERRSTRQVGGRVKLKR